MVVAPDDVGDTHVMVVDHHRQHVSRRAVRTEQDEIVQLGIGHGHPALHEVVDRRFALPGRLDANDKGRALGPVGAVTPFAVDAERAALGLRLFAASGQFFRCQEAAVGRPALDQLMGDLGVALLELRLEIGIAVAADTEPIEPVEDGVDGFLRRPGAIGILDAEQILTAVMPGEQPVEQRRAGTADMKIARRRGREAGDHAGNFAACACHIFVACAEARFPFFCWGRWTG